MPRNRHTRLLDIRRSKRPGPITSAAESAVGKRARGNDGKMYVVKMDARGCQEMDEAEETIVQKSTFAKWYLVQFHVWR